MKLSVCTLWKCHPFTMFGYPIVTYTWPNRVNSGQSDRSISIRYPRSSWIGFSGRTLTPSMRSMRFPRRNSPSVHSLSRTPAASGREGRRSAVIMEGQGLSRGRSLLTAVRIRKMQLKIVLVGERRGGKTSLLERDLKKHFAEAYQGTLGGRVYPTEP